MMIGLCLGLLAWVVLLCVLDRPTVPAYKARNAYRVLVGVLLLGLTMMTMKAVAYRAELRGLVRAYSP